MTWLVIWFYRRWKQHSSHLRLHSLRLIVAININNNIAGKADFYGPFWIFATLVFSLAAAGNISNYLATPVLKYYLIVRVMWSSSIILILYQLQLHWYDIIIKVIGIYIWIIRSNCDDSNNEVIWFINELFLSIILV